MGRYIVVGQGIAGSILAHTLIKQGHTVTVIDKHSGAGSSRVAAGIYHPLVFKRTTLTWKADELFSFLENYYPELEKELGVKCYHPMPYYRLFSTQEEHDNWVKYRALPEYQSFLGDDADTLPTADYKLTHGVGELLRSGWVDTNKMLDAFRNLFIAQNNLVDEQFDYSIIEFAGEEIKYKNLVADKIIFAEGYGIVNNPYFNYLPLKATKGQVLSIESNLPTDGIYNRKVFVLPLGSRLSTLTSFKIGSTYEWAWDVEEPTEAIKADLLGKLDALINTQYTVTEHQAGIRPSTTDRRPYVGIHPQHPQLAVFNGMGSKGIMLAPYFAAEFAGFLAGNNAIDKESDIARFSPTP